MSKIPETIVSQPMQRILAVLRRHDRTAEEIADRAYVSINTLSRGGYLKAMCARGDIHIYGWKPPMKSGNWSAIYRAGKGKDAQRPPAAGNTEYARRWRAKNPDYRPRKPKAAGVILTDNELRKVRLQAKALTEHAFTLAGQLGL